MTSHVIAAMTSDANDEGWEDLSMWIRGLFAAALAWFVWSTAGVLAQHSYPGFFLIAGANSATRLMLLDLMIVLTLAGVWIVRDAREHSGSYGPFLLLALLFGAAGPLAYGATRKLGKGVQRAAALALLVGLGAYAVKTWPLADLRTDQARRGDPADAERGRDLLEDTARRHGLEAWKAHTTLEVEAVDVWPGGGPWWPQATQAFRSQALLGTFTSRAELLDGPGRGQVWGIQSWQCYRADGGDASFLPEADPAMEFYLPTLQYFNELPFRLLAADVALFNGPATLRGRQYERILVSWRTAAPQEEVDQYDLWIDSKTGLIAMARYTLRDAITMSPGLTGRMMRSLAMGTIHFEDYREIDGVLFPFVQTVTLPEPMLTEHLLEENFFHRLEVRRARFDTVEASELVPDPSLGLPADAKPSTPN